MIWFLIAVVVVTVLVLCWIGWPRVPECGGYSANPHRVFAARHRVPVLKKELKQACSDYANVQVVWRGHLLLPDMLDTIALRYASLSEELRQHEAILAGDEKRRSAEAEETRREAASWRLRIEQAISRSAGE